MAAKNEKKKLTFEDKFARHFYCQHARLNSIRQDKKTALVKCARLTKKFAVKPLTIKRRCDIINTSKGNELTGRQGNSQARKLPPSILIYQ